MFSKLTVALVACTLFASAGCAAPFGADDGSVDSHDSALKGGGSTDSLTLSGSVAYDCQSTGTAWVGFSGELTSRSNASVFVQISGAFSNTFEIPSSNWSKAKSRIKTGTFSSGADLPSGDYALTVCASQSGFDDPGATCASYSFVVACPF